VYDYQKYILKLIKHVENGGKIIINPFRYDKATKHTELYRKLVEQALKEKNT